MQIIIMIVKLKHASISSVVATIVLKKGCKNMLVQISTMKKANSLLKLLNKCFCCCKNDYFCNEIITGFKMHHHSPTMTCAHGH